MGYWMASNLHKSLNSSSQKGEGDTLHIFDTSSAAVDSFLAEHPGSVASPSSAHCVAAADRIITMLPNTEHVQSVFAPFLSPSAAKTSPQAGDFSKDLAGKLFIDSSTIAPAATKTLADQLAERGATLVDAPVSGGVVGSKAASLTFMVSCPPSLPFPTLEAILGTMGKRIVLCGSHPGAGLAAKLANNYLLALANLATCDAMLLGQKLGLDPHVLAQVLNTSTGRCWPSETNNPVPGVSKGAPAERDYEGGFGVALMRKDLQLALDAERQAATVASAGSDSATDLSSASEEGSLSRLSEMALKLYKDVEATERFAKKDFSVVYQYLKEVGDK